MKYAISVVSMVSAMFLIAGCSSAPRNTGPRSDKTWKAPNGWVWTSYQGDYSNEGSKQGSEISGSEASDACEKIHARLPSKSDFDKLMSFFGQKGEADVESDPITGITKERKELTAGGRDKLHEALPDTARHSFWTSSYNPHSTNHGFTWNGTEGTFGLDGLGDDFGVMCVRK